MIINWIEVRPSEKDENATEYIVGATTEERVRSAGFLDVDETNPVWVTLKVYPPCGSLTNHLTGHILCADLNHPEYQPSVEALKALMACVLEVQGLSEKDARNKLWGRVIEPHVFNALGLPPKNATKEPHA